MGGFDKDDTDEEEEEEEEDNKEEEGGGRSEDMLSLTWFSGADVDTGFLPLRPLTGCVCTAVFIVEDIVVVVVVVVVVEEGVVEEGVDCVNGIEGVMEDDGGGINISFVGLAAVESIGTEEEEEEG